MGNAFERVAETKKAELEAVGYTAIVRRASSFDDFNSQLTSNGMLVEVEYAVAFTVHDRFLI